MSRRRFRIDRPQLRITRGALILLLLELGMSVVWALSDAETKASLARWLVATPGQVWRDGKVWTLVTAPLVEIRFISLLLQAFMLWTFLPTLERFWGTRRFLRFAAMTAIVGTVAGTAMGMVTGHEVPITGLDTVVFSGVVAYGIIYARQPIQFFGVLPLTGRQLMYGFLGFLTLFTVLQQAWEEGAAFAAALGLTGLIVSKKWNPGQWWRRYRRRRARKHLDVLQGGGDAGTKRDRDDPPRWIN